jgi:hypothetical protein
MYGYSYYRDTGRNRASRSSYRSSIDRAYVY